MGSLEDTSIVGNLLRDLLNPQTAREATEKMKEMSKNGVELCAPLVIQMSQNPDSSIRQLAAVALRRRLNKAWHSIPSNYQADIKQTLLRRLVEDDSRLVRISVAHVVSGLTKLILNEWKTELFSFLNSCSESNDASHREAAQTVFCSILDSSGEQLRPYHDDFATILAKGLQDQDVGVRLAATKGVAVLSTLAEGSKDFSRLRKLLPLMIGVAEDALVSRKEDLVGLVLGVLDDLVDQERALKADDVQGAVRFVLNVVGSPLVSSGLKEQALSFIHSVAQQNPKYLTRNNLYEDIITAAVRLAIIPEDATEDDFDDEVVPGYRKASQCIDSLALNLPPNLIFQKTVQVIGPLLTSGNPWERRAALVLLGIMSEGCSEIMCQKIDQLIPHVLAGFSFSDTKVKSGAATCLGQMANYLQPEIVRCHGTVMPVLLEGIRSPHTDPSVKEKLCIAVELFCDNMEEFEIAAHLNTLVPTLLEALQTGPSNAVRENCIGALGSAAQASKSQFEPYVSKLMPVLLDALSQSTPELIPLRARATACVGSIVEGLPQTIAPYHERLLGQVLEGLEKLDFYDLREASYRFLSGLAVSLKGGLAPLLSKIMPFVMASLLNDDGVVADYGSDSEEDDEGDERVGSRGPDLLNGVDSDEDAEDQRRIRGFHVRTGFLDEQESATAFLISLYENIPGAQMEVWMQSSLECVETLSRSFHRTVRQVIPPLMLAMLMNVHEMFGTPTENSGAICAGRGAKSSGGSGARPRGPLHPNTFQLWVEKFWPVFHSMLSEDEDKVVVGEAASAMGELLETLGADLLRASTVLGHNVQESLLRVVLSIFSKDHPSQRHGDSEAPEGEGGSQPVLEEDDVEEYQIAERSLSEGALLLVAGLAQAMGEAFFVPFQKLNPKLLHLASNSQSNAYRMLALGSFAEIFKSLGVCAAGFAAPVIPAALLGVQQRVDSDLCRNAAYCIASIASFGEALPKFQTFVIEALKVLLPVISEPVANMRQESLCARDNALTAVASLLRHFSVQAVPQREVLPTFLAALPLKADMQESASVVETLCYLYSDNGCPSEIRSEFRHSLLAALIGEVANESITQPLQQEVEAILKAELQDLGLSHPWLHAIVKDNPKYQEFLQLFIAKAFSQ